MELKIKKDWEWFLAEVDWNDNIFAYWETKEEAKKEFLWVLDMMIDFHSELVESEKKLKNSLVTS